MEKKKSIVFKKIIVSILSILFVVCAYVPSIPKVNALSNVTSYNSYGGYTWQITDLAFDMSGNVTLSSAQISMNLNGHYSGTFQINIQLSTIIDTSGIGYTNTINNYGFICKGCMITSYSSTTLYVRIVDSNYWEIQIIPIKNASILNWRSILNALDISSITGWSMTKLDEITSSQVTTISNTLTSINSNISTTNSRLTTLNTEVHSILNAIGNNARYGSLQYQLYTILGNTASENDKLQAISNKLTGYLTGTIDNQEVNIWDLVNDTNYSLDSINTILNTINSNINDYTSILNTIQNTLSNIDTNLSNIDNIIDTITFKPVTSGVTFNQISDYVYRSNKITYYERYQKTSILRFRIHIENNNTNRNYNNFKLLTGSQAQTVVSENVYVNYSRYVIDVYFWDAVSAWSTANNYIQFETDRSGLIVNSVDLEYIDSNDIEYWSLLSYFNQYDSNLRILEAINGISVNITQSDINKMNNNITEYNSTMTDINQIENNYINNFTTIDNNIDLTNNSSPSVNLVNARTQFNSVFNDITGDLRIRGLLIFVLICGIILILLGA